jgi:putative transposase
MKQVADRAVASHGYSQRRACRLMRHHRSTQRKPSTLDPRTEIRRRMNETIAVRVRYGYQRVHIMLAHEGWRLRRNIVYRLSRHEGLALSTKRLRRRKMAVYRKERQHPSRANEA